MERRRCGWMKGCEHEKENVWINGRVCGWDEKRMCGWERVRICE